MLLGWLLTEKECSGESDEGVKLCCVKLCGSCTVVYKASSRLSCTCIRTVSKSDSYRILLKIIQPWRVVKFKWVKNCSFACWTHECVEYVPLYRCSQGLWDNTPIVLLTVWTCSERDGFKTLNRTSRLHQDSGMCHCSTHEHFIKLSEIMHLTFQRKPCQEGSMTRTYPKEK